MTLRADDLRLRLDDTPVLDGVSLTLVPGQLTALIGPNGAGKSSLLRLLAGLRRPDSGRVSLDGRPLPCPPDAAAARRLAYLAQGRDIHWPLTVDKLVALGRLPHQGPFRGPGPADRAAVEAALAATHTRDLRHRVATTLSGGELARVLLARALAQAPAVLLADEPTAGLDPLHQVQMLALLRQLAQGGGDQGEAPVAVLAVLHDLAGVAAWCDRVVVLHEGAIVADGPPADTLLPPLLRRVYGVTVTPGRLDGLPVFAVHPPETP